LQKQDKTETQRSRDRSRKVDIKGVLGPRDHGIKKRKREKVNVCEKKKREREREREKEREREREIVLPYLDEH